jgi:tetratricopeptide (TPR) repeat protein
MSGAKAVGVRRVAAPLALLSLAAAVAVGIWWWGRGSGPPEPPAVALEGADPEVAAAVTEVRGGVLREPKSAAAWGALGEVLLANQFPADAEVCLARAETLDAAEPRWPYLRAWELLPRDRDAAIEAFRRAVERSREDDPLGVAARLRLAEMLLTVGANEEAGALFRRVLDNDPANVRARFGMGMVASALDESERAVADLSQCTDSTFTRKKALSELAALAQRRGDDAAAELFTRRTNGMPKDMDWPDPYLWENAQLAVGRRNRFIEGEQLQRAGRLAEAAAQFRGLIKEYPDDAPARVKLGMALDQMGDYAAAESVLRAAVQLSPDESQAYYFLSVALFHQAERLGAGPRALQLYQRAEDCARKATELKPDHAFAYLYLGLALKALGRKEEAIASLRKAVLYSPDSTEPHLHLGEALAESGQRKEGIVELERAAELAGEGDARPGDALLQFGHGGKAVESGQGRPR